MKIVKENRTDTNAVIPKALNDSGVAVFERSVHQSLYALNQKSTMR